MKNPTEIGSHIIYFIDFIIVHTEKELFTNVNISAQYPPKKKAYYKKLHEIFLNENRS